MEIEWQRSFDDLGTPLHQVTFVVVDVETTGGSPASASLTEVAAARYRGGERLGTYQTLVRPDERIPPLITALTGISDGMVSGAPRADEMLPSFLEFVGGAVLVGHNLRFDVSFLDHALLSTGRERLTNARVDTLALSRRLVRDMVPNCKLGTLASVLRLPHQPSHRALADVLATGDLLHALLERAGSFGIVGLDELLVLTRLLGHPQAGKLRLTTRLPHRPGVYWFTDASGTVLYVGKATDLQTRVRSYFAGDRRSNVGRLLRQLHTVNHRVCPGPLSAAVMESRLIKAWSPSFNQKGKMNARRKKPVGSGRTSDSPRRRHSDRSCGRRPTLSSDELSTDPTELLSPMVERLVRLADRQQYEEAAAVRDEVGRLCTLLDRHRHVTSLRAAGHVVLVIEGEGMVELDDGLLVSQGGTPDCRPVVPLPADPLGDDRDDERIIVSQWLNANSERVRIVEVERDPGLCMPSDRIPSLVELVGNADTRRSIGGYGSAA